MQFNKLCQASQPDRVSRQLARRDARTGESGWDDLHASACLARRTRHLRRHGIFATTCRCPGQQRMRHHSRGRALQLGRQPRALPGPRASLDRNGRSKPMSRMRYALGAEDSIAACRPRQASCLRGYPGKSWVLTTSTNSAELCTPVCRCSSASGAVSPPNLAPNGSVNPCRQPHAPRPWKSRPSLRRRPRPHA